MLRRRVLLRRSVPLQGGLPPKRDLPVRKKRSRPRRGPERSPEYLAWIRTLGCVVCSGVSRGSSAIEAVHTNVLGPRGVGQKTSDFSAIPLCAALTGRIWTRTIVLARGSFRISMELS
jgi:hypothetical protein